MVLKRTFSRSATTHAYLGSLEGVVVSEVDIDHELSSLVRGADGTNDGDVPLGDVVSLELDGHAFECVVVQVVVFLFRVKYPRIPC